MGGEEDRRPAKMTGITFWSERRQEREGSTRVEQHTTHRGEGGREGGREGGKMKIRKRRLPCQQGQHQASFACAVPDSLGVTPRKFD